jgi:hypothetical protein
MYVILIKLICDEIFKILIQNIYHSLFVDKNEPNNIK